MKKFLAVFLTVVLIFSLSVVSFAADATDVSYFKLAKAAEDIAFEFDEVTQDSDRVFYKIDGTYYLYYFSPITSVKKVDEEWRYAVHAYKSYKFDGVKWMSEDEVYLGALPSNSSIAYCEKAIGYGDRIIPENVSGLTRGLKDSVGARDLDGIWQTIKPLIPILAVAIVGFLAFRKGWSFLKGEAANA